MNQTAPPPPNGIFSEEADKIIIATVTCVTAFVLLLAFLIAITRFRLWHTCWILENILKMVDHPVTYLITQGFAFVGTAPYKDDLYLIWLVVIIIAYDNFLTISPVYTLSSGWLLRAYINLFYSIYLGFYINQNIKEQEYYIPLLVLWSLILAKFSIRFVLNKLVKRAYGLNNSKVVADFMKIEHKLAEPNEVIDPTSMKGYKYLVMGEGKINPIVTGPEYAAQIELPASVVTVEKVWSCNERLLDPYIDADNRLRDICLSFAFSKLLKRRFFEYKAAEAQHEKTRKLVFDGLLRRHDTDSVYTLLKTEIGFLRDFFYTMHPISFALGFPVFQIVVLTGMLGVSVWISLKAFHRHEDREDSYLTSHHHNIDYTITNAVLIIIVVMEFLETLSYVFSDWTKVMLICRYVRSRIHHNHCFYDKVLALLFKWKFSRSVNNTIGQYSLLKNYNRIICPDWTRVNCFPYSTWGWSPLKVPPKGMKKDKAVKLSQDVKEAILGSLRLINSYPTNGIVSLNRNGMYDDLAWTCGLETEFHTLTVWHIATGFCEIHPVKEGGNKKSIEPHHLVAFQLSNYCAYLMVFFPDVLPDSIFSVKLFFREILSETKEFFNGARNSEDKYDLMTRCRGDGNRVIDMGVRLGRYLMDIPDDAYRWKIMAEFWSEFIVFLAPSGNVRVHLKMLESGGEFITHIWALLYHAGIVDHTTATSSRYYP